MPIRLFSLNTTILTRCNLFSGKYGTNTVFANSELLCEMKSSLDRSIIAVYFFFIHNTCLLLLKTITKLLVRCPSAPL